MRRASHRLAAALVLAATGCAPGLWERSNRFRLGSDPARLLVPRTFAPLVPGSIYPDRGRPLPARGLPGVLLVRRKTSAREITEPLGRRGLVVLEMGPSASLEAGIEKLRTSPESGGRIGVLLEDPDRAVLEDALNRRGVIAVVVFGRIPAFSGSRSNLLVLRAGSPSGTSAEGASERWYASGSGKLPTLAFQDAADWISERLEGGITRRS